MHLVALKYKDSLILPSTHSVVNQEITLCNDGERPWPPETILELSAELSKTDIKVASKIKIGALPVAAMVKVYVRVDPHESTRRHHFIVYHLSRKASNENHFLPFSNPISFQFRIAPKQKQKEAEPEVKAKVPLKNLNWCTMLKNNISGGPKGKNSKNIAKPS